MHPGLKVFTTSKNKTFFFNFATLEASQTSKGHALNSILYIFLFFLFCFVFSSDNLVIFFFLLSRLGFGITKKKKAKLHIAIHRRTSMQQKSK